jgi:hypothetical protein
MASWFGYGAPSKEEQEEERQQAPLVAHDDMEDRAEKAAKKERKDKKKASKAAEAAGSEQPPESPRKAKRADKHKIAAKSNADAAESAAKAMEDAMSWWKKPPVEEPAGESSLDAEVNAQKMKSAMSWLDGKDENPDADADLLGYDVTEDPDLMALPEVEEFTAANLSFDILSNLKDDKTPKYKRMDTKSTKLTAAEAEARTKKMREAVTSWSNHTTPDTKGGLAPLDIDQGATEMKDVVQWWASTGKYYEPNTAAIRSSKMRKVVDRYAGKTGDVEGKTKNMQKSLTWWKKNHTIFQEMMGALNSNVGKMQKVNHLFDWFSAS